MKYSNERQTAILQKINDIFDELKLVTAMNNIKVLLHALVEEKIGSLQVQGRDKLQDNWVSGVVTVDTKKNIFEITYKDGDRETYPTKTQENDDDSLFNEFDMGYIKLDVDSDPVAALGSAQQVT